MHHKFPSPQGEGMKGVRILEANH